MAADLLMHAMPGARRRVWRNARLATLNPNLPGLGIIDHGALVVEPDAPLHGQILFAGPQADLPADLVQGAEVIDCEGRLITPGLIDCHTHLVHAGNRANEFEMRLAGASYEAIARAGGGIASSVAALRAASEDDLLSQTLTRLDALIAEGVTTVEIKSGYGLDHENEAKSLRVAQRLDEARGINVEVTCLAAHAMPPGHAGDKDAYIDEVIAMLPRLAKAARLDAVDAFCEGIAFSPAQVARVFDAAKALGLPVKLHADQLSDCGGAALAARYGALSADHLEYASEEGVAAMAKAGTVAVMLPGAYYFIRETKKPPVALFREHGVPMAVATDCNPGTSPMTSILLAMNMAATLFDMTVEECIIGVTRNAAQALGVHGEVGTLETGKQADFAIWDVETPAELVYRIGFNPLHSRVFQGKADPR